MKFKLLFCSAKKVALTLCACCVFISPALSVATGYTGGSIDLGTLTWEFKENGIYMATIEGTNIDSKKAGVSNCYIEGPTYTLGTSTDTLTNNQYIGNATTNNVYIKNTTVANASALQTALSGVKMYYQKTTEATWFPPVIQVATTKYVETQFTPISTELNTTIGTIETVVENTITQADRIEALHTGKQNRPDDYNDDEKCPDGYNCLLISDANGVPHWYPIEPGSTSGGDNTGGGSSSTFDTSAFLAQLTSNGDSSYYHGNDTTYREITGNSTATAYTYQPGKNDGVPQLEETEWAVEWTGKGVVYGTSVCNNTSGSEWWDTGIFTKSNSEKESKGQYCWCQMTGLADTSMTEPTSSVGSWVFRSGLGNADGCANNCAYNCAYNVQNESDFRAAVLGGGD